jgi:hypothetical protein
MLSLQHCIMMTIIIPLDHIADPGVKARDSLGTFSNRCWNVEGTAHDAVTKGTCCHEALACTGWEWRMGWRWRRGGWGGR